MGASIHLLVRCGDSSDEDHRFIHEHIGVWNNLRQVPAPQIAIVSWRGTSFFLSTSRGVDYNFRGTRDTLRNRLHTPPSYRTGWHPESTQWPLGALRAANNALLLFVARSAMPLRALHASHIHELSVRTILLESCCKARSKLIFSLSYGGEPTWAGNRCQHLPRTHTTSCTRPRPAEQRLCRQACLSIQS